ASVNGGEAFIEPASNAWMTWRSLWHRPAAPTFTRTWPGPGSGTGTSWYSGGVFHPTMRNAFIHFLPVSSAPDAGQSAPDQKGHRANGARRPAAPPRARADRGQHLPRP